MAIEGTHTPSAAAAVVLFIYQYVHLVEVLNKTMRTYHQTPRQVAAAHTGDTPLEAYAASAAAEVVVPAS